MKLDVTRSERIGCTILALLAMMVPEVQAAPQVPIPRTAAEVPGPAPGPLTKAYVQSVGRTPKRDIAKAR